MHKHGINLRQTQQQMHHTDAAMGQTQCSQAFACSIEPVQHALSAMGSKAHEIHIDYEAEAVRRPISHAAERVTFRHAFHVPQWLPLLHLYLSPRQNHQ
jgi:hypothetical protein